MEQPAGFELVGMQTITDQGESLASSTSGD
jgi:hypothetical protein